MKEKEHSRGERLGKEDIKKKVKKIIKTENLEQGKNRDHKRG